MTRLARKAVVGFCGWGVFVAACADGTPNPDRAYVVGFCSAAADFQAESSVLKPEGPWTGVALEALGAAYDSWADALHDIVPPTDIVDFHTALIDEIRTAAAALPDASEPGQAIRRLGLLTFPEEPAERLSAVAAGVEECTTANYRFDGPIGVI